MLTAGMGMQKRRQALQECQRQHQIEIFKALAHRRILIRDHAGGNLSTLGKAGQSKLGFGPACVIAQSAAYATHAMPGHIDLIESISGTPFA